MAADAMGRSRRHIPPSTKSLYIMLLIITYVFLNFLLFFLSFRLNDTRPTNDAGNS